MFSVSILVQCVHSRSFMFGVSILSPHALSSDQAHWWETENSRRKSLAIGARNTSADFHLDQAYGCESEYLHVSLAVCERDWIFTSNIHSCHLGLISDIFLSDACMVRTFRNHLSIVEKRSKTKPNFGFPGSELFSWSPNFGSVQLGRDCSRHVSFAMAAEAL